MTILRIISKWKNSCLLCTRRFFLIYQPYIKFLTTTNQTNIFFSLCRENFAQHILFARGLSNPKSSIPVRKLKDHYDHDEEQNHSKRIKIKSKKTNDSTNSNSNKEQVDDEDDDDEDKEMEEWLIRKRKEMKLKQIKLIQRVQKFYGFSTEDEEKEENDKVGSKKNKKETDDSLDKILKEREEKMFADLERQFGKEFASHMRKVYEDIEKLGDPKSKKRQNFFWLIIILALIMSLITTIMFGPKNRETPFDKISEITWTDFLNRIVKSGEVSRVMIGRLNLWESSSVKAGHRKSSEIQGIKIIMNKGAVDKKGIPFEPVYYVDVPTNRLGTLESKIREAEIAAGLPPQRWANIFWIERNISSSFIMQAIGLLIFFLPILFFRKAMKNAGGMFGGNMSSIMSSMMGHRIRIMDPSSREGKKGLLVRFRDVAGMHEAKMEVSEFVDYLRRPKKYTRLGARLPKGALLTGPPGCGKTLLAKALAAESSVPFININGTEFVEMIGGMGASRVRQLFAEAKSRAPSIIYIDEIDTIGRRRQNDFNDMSGGHSEIEQTLNQLLVEMDGMDTAGGIVVIASTNRPDILDKALLRPGRFDRHVSIDLPTVAERKEMFDLYLRKIKKENQLTGVSQRLAQMTPGFSGADIKNVVNESAIHAATKQKKMVTIEDVHYALDKIMAGPEKRTKTLVEEERQIVAFHESGHALVGWLLEHTEALLKVTIIPRTSAALGFAQYSPKDRKLFTKEELFDRMCMMLGGRAAENVTFGRITTGAQNDLEKVTKQAQAMVKWYGMSDQVGSISFFPAAGTDPRSADFMEKPYSKQLGNLIDQEISRLVSKAYFTTENLLKENKDKLEKLATNLLKRETLTYEEVKNLIGPPKFGDKNVVDLPEDVLPDLSKSAT